MAPITKKDLSDVLTDFYGRVIEPQFNRLNKRLDEHDKKFTDLFAHFDQIYSGLDRLETEYYTITAGLQRLEDRMGSIEEKLDKEIDIRERLEKEVSDLKQRVISLQARIEEIENHLKTIS